LVTQELRAILRRHSSSLHSAFSSHYLCRWELVVYYAWPTEVRLTTLPTGESLRSFPAWRSSSSASLAGSCRSLGSLFIYWICNGALLLFLYAKAYQAWGGKRRLPFWSAMSAATSVFFLLDYFTQDTPMMLFPRLCLFYAWFRPWWRRRPQEKAKT
jgi:hypothetical protein